MSVKQVLYQWMISLLVFKNFVCYSSTNQQQQLLSIQDSTYLCQPIENLVKKEYINLYFNAREQNSPNWIECFFRLEKGEFKINIFYRFEEEIKNKPLPDKFVYINSMIKNSMINDIIQEGKKREKTILLDLIKNINESDIIKLLIQSKELQCENFTLCLKEDPKIHRIYISFEKNGFFLNITQNIKYYFNSFHVNSSKKYN